MKNHPYVQYIEAQDRSEEFGWKKVKDETPTDPKEQERWSRYLAIFSAKLATIPLLLEV